MNERMTQPLYLCKIGRFCLLTILHRNEFTPERQKRDFYIDIVCEHNFNHNIYVRIQREKIDSNFGWLRGKWAGRSKKSVKTTTSCGWGWALFIDLCKEWSKCSEGLKSASKPLKTTISCGQAGILFIDLCKTRINLWNRFKNAPKPLYVVVAIESYS